MPKQVAPAEHLELVAVAGTDRIGPVLDQQSNDAEMLFLRGEVQRHRVVALVADVGIGAAIEQPLDGRLVAAVDLGMQGRPRAPMAGKAASLVDDARVRVEQFSAIRSASPRLAASSSAATAASSDGPLAACATRIFSADQPGRPCSSASAC